MSPEPPGEAERLRAALLEILRQLALKQGGCMARIEKLASDALGGAGFRLVVR